MKPTRWVLILVALCGAVLVPTAGLAEQAAPKSSLLLEIAAWLSKEFDLPASNDVPNVEFVSPVRITALRYPGLVTSSQQEETATHQATLNAETEVMAVYLPPTRTIYLRDGWRGTTPAEVSILVHEMVHHLQSRAQIKYDCPQAREKLAYAAQDRWLQRSNRSLASEFEIDGFTLLVRTACGP
jgi:uncharacterized protein DUF6647